MGDIRFKAMVVSEGEGGIFTREIAEKSTEDLPEGEVLVKVLYSSLNYKDALSATGNRGVTKKYPHTPGIDAAGVVEESRAEDFNPGDEVIVTSYDLGMNTSGGFGQYIRVPAAWVVPLPPGLTLHESMIYGTAGFTAGLSIYRLIMHGVSTEHGEILVSGATGGVGGIAVAVLSKIGYSVTAVNGSVDATDYLKELGAEHVISIEEAENDAGRPILKGRWAGAVDTVGGKILATALKAAEPDAAVTCCGNVASPDLSINVFPFILRGVTLYGIDSQNCPMYIRAKIWEKLATDWNIVQTGTLAKDISLNELDQTITDMTQRKRRGRSIVHLWE